MKTLYLECAMGAAGDMLAAALLELIPKPESFIKKINNIGLPPEIKFSVQPCEKCGIHGTRLFVRVNGIEEKSADRNNTKTVPNHLHENSHSREHDNENGHRHSSIEHLHAVIDSLTISDKLKSNIKSVYTLLAEAESYVHKTPVDNIHFHEVGTSDALADITAVCMLIDMLAPERINCSPINTGSGSVYCAHGILPVPTPAVAHILRNIPVYSNGIQAELCTPTGAALLAHFASSFTPMPLISFSTIGYGMGQKSFEQANCLRAYLGHSFFPHIRDGQTSNTEEIAELTCNLDDMTPEDVSFAQEILFENGALDVYTVPIGMKKSRAAIQLNCLCHFRNAKKMAELMFMHTSTLGVRQTMCRRYFLERTESLKQTPYGQVRIKTAQAAGHSKTKAEYEDVAQIARTRNIPLSVVRRAAETEK